MDTPADRIARLVAYLRTPGIPPYQTLRTREQLEDLAAEAGISVAEALAPARGTLSKPFISAEALAIAPSSEMHSKALICAHPDHDAEVSTFAPEVDQPSEDDTPEDAEPDDAALEQGVSTSPRAMKVATVEEAIRANPELSDRAIARACGVSPTTAGRVRMRLVSASGFVRQMP